MKIRTVELGAIGLALFLTVNVHAQNVGTAYGGTYPSDARSKNIIGRSDSAKDLETLEKIEITDYTMKDTITFGTRPMKKVIAQQVEKAYPAAVQSVGAKGDHADNIKTA